MKRLWPTHLRGRDESGQALVLAIAIVVITLVLGLASVELMLSATKQGFNDARTRAAQQASDSGIQQTLLDQSDSDAVGYNFTGGVLGAGTLLDCVSSTSTGSLVPPVLSTASGALSPLLSASLGPCPPSGTGGCDTGKSCPPTKSDWTNAGNGAYFESEMFPNSVPQSTGSTTASSYAVEFPQIVSIGCHTQNASPQQSCLNGDSGNAYARQMAVLVPTAPLQALEGENDVSVTSPISANPLCAIVPALCSTLNSLLSGLGVGNVLTGTSVIDGNIVAGHDVSLPGTPVNTNLSGLSLGSVVLGILGGGTSPFTALTAASVGATFSYGNSCTTGGTWAGGTDPAGGTDCSKILTSALLGTFNKTGSTTCTAGSPSTNCFLKRPGFKLTGVSATTCASTSGTAISTGKCTVGTGNLTGDASGNATLAPGTYVFCNVNVTGTLSQTTKGPLEIFIAAPGSNGCAGASGSLKASISSPTPPASATAGSSVSFQAGSSGASGSVVYTWAVSNETGAVATPTDNGSGGMSYTFLTPGQYQVTVTASSGGQTASYSTTVTVNPSAALTLTWNTDVSVMANGFSVTAGGGTSPYAYKFDFGDGTAAVSSGSTSSTTYSFKSMGSYLPRAMVTDSAVGLAAQSVRQTVGTALAVNTAGAGGNNSVPVLTGAGLTCPTTGTAGTALSCTGTAASGGSGAGYSYGWNFGDKGSSGAGSATGLAPSYTYGTAGSYLPQLTTVDTSGQVQRAVASSPVVVSPPASLLSLAGQMSVTSSATTAGTVLAAPGTVTFKANGTATAITVLGVTLGGGPCSATIKCTYAWNFGDGATKTDSAVSGADTGVAHAYASAGVYTASVTITGQQGTTTFSAATYDITVIVGSGPSALAISSAPTASAQTGTLNSSGQFAVTFGSGTWTGGTGSDTYSWVFSGGGSMTGGTGQNPVYTYTSPGRYTATLTVKDSGTPAQQATYIFTIWIKPANTLAAGTPAVSPTTGTAASTSFQFGDAGTGGSGSYTYAWDFGDGATGTGAAPTHTYATAGTYTATVYATDPSDGKTVSSAVQVSVNAASGAASATGGNFIADGGVNNLLGNQSITSNALDPSALQIYVQGSASDALTSGDTDCLTPGSASVCPTTSVIIGDTSPQAVESAVIYAPRSTVNVNTLVAQGSYIGWDLNINALSVLQDLDLGNYPLASVVNAYQVHQTVECDTSVKSLTITNTDLNGCT